MNIPDLPTDNLYKFMATFGLVLFIGCLALDSYMSVKYSEQITDYLTIDVLKEYSDDELVIFGTTAKELSKMYIPAINKKIIADRILENIRTIKLGQLIGAVISVIGFLLWYVKLQYHIDVEINKQRENEKNITVGEDENLK